MKTRIIVTLVFLALLPYEPFIFRTMMEPVVFVPIWICLFLAISYIGVDYVRDLKSLILAASLCIVWITYRAAFNREYLNASLVDAFMVLYTMVILSSSKRIAVSDLLNRYWLRFLVTVSVLEIFAWLAANLNMLPYEVVQTGETSYAYRNTYLGMAYDGAFFLRPSLWFAEPSYVGLFSGLNFYYILGAPIKPRNKVLLLSLVAAAGSLSGSLTYWVGFPVTFIFWLLFTRTLRINKAILNSIILCAAIGAVVMSTTRWYAFDEVAIEFSTSYRERVARMSISADMLSTSTVSQLIFGRGSGAIVKRSEIGGESNLLIKLLVEQGLIVLVGYVWLVYYYTRHQPALFLYCMICSVFIVGMLTPWAILNLFLILQVARKSTEPSRTGLGRHESHVAGRAQYLQSSPVAH